MQQKTLDERIEHIDDYLKVNEIDYEHRLKICSKCKYVFEGMCRACGCFVRLRGVMKKNNCPYSKW